MKKLRLLLSSRSFIGAVVVVIIMVAVLVVVLAVTRGGESNGETPAYDWNTMPESWRDGRIVGNPEALVTISVFEDFLCGTCEEWVRTIEPRLIEDYIGTGKARLQFHHFPLRNHAPGARMAALASECAADENLFWEYHDILFAEGRVGGQAALTVDKLVSYAVRLGLDSDSFRACVENEMYEDRIDESIRVALETGIGYLPSVSIDGVVLVDSFDYKAITKTIDRALRKAKRQASNR